MIYLRTDLQMTSSLKLFPNACVNGAYYVNNVWVEWLLDGGLSHPVVFTIQSISCLISAIEQQMVSGVGS